jgi:cytidylate kinase
MNVITVTREYGAGGYEVAHALAEALGWELLDRQLLHRAAALEHLPDAELERLDEKAVSLIDRFRLNPPHQKYIHGLREAALEAAARGNVVLVGRGTGHLLADRANVIHLRLVAPREWRARRMAQRESWSLEQAVARCTAEDQTRDRFTRYFFGDAPFQPGQYHLTFNTSRVALEDVVTCVAALARDDLEAALPASAAGPRVLTLARELGAGERSFAPALAARLQLNVYDRELLEQEALKLGVSEAELEQVDEQPPGVFQRLLPGSLPQRYFEAVGRLMKTLAAHGRVLLVGRGGNRFLRDEPGAFHLRLVAPSEVRVRRVMEQHWMNEEAARQLLAQSDGRRRRFHQSYFGADWADPLEYHLTVNAGRLGPAAVPLAALAAERYWARPTPSASGKSG